MTRNRHMTHIQHEVHSFSAIFPHCSTEKMVCQPKRLHFRHFCPGIIRPSSTQARTEVIFVAKQGMARPDRTKLHPKNAHAPVPDIQGKAKSGKIKANPIIAGTMGAQQKVWHEKPIPQVYSTIDTDLARDNLENDIPLADLEDLK